MSCEHCPCPEICLAWPVFCEHWAPGGDAVLRAHICHRSRSGPASPPRTYPSPASQVRGAARALGRLISAIVRGKPGLASPGLVERRKSICRSCDRYDAAQGRCRACGCGGLKLHLLTERCPLDPPRW